MLIAPHNLVTALSWFDPVRGRPAFRRHIQYAFQEYDELFRLTYSAEAVEVFDGDGDGEISDIEARIDTPEKFEWSREKMREVGIADPYLRLEILPFSLEHNIVSGDQAIRECTECHSAKSRLLEPVEVFDFVPWESEIEVSSIVDVPPVGSPYLVKDGKVWYDPSAYLTDYYILGATHVPWVERVGWAAVLMSIGGAGLHGAIRWGRGARRKGDAK